MFAAAALIDFARKHLGDLLRVRLRSLQLVMLSRPWGGTRSTPAGGPPRRAHDQKVATELRELCYWRMQSVDALLPGGWILPVGLALRRASTSTTVPGCRRSGQNATTTTSSTLLKVQP